MTRFPALGPLAGLLVAAALPAAGCGLTPAQKTAVQRFSTATIRVAATAEAGLTALRDDVVALRRDRIAIQNLVRPAERRQPAGAALRGTELGSRLEALRTLRRFAELLGALATGTQSDRAAAASLDLFDAALRVSPDAVPPGERDLIADLIRDGAAGLVEYERRAAVRRVVAVYRPVVERIAAAIRKDLDPDARLLAGALLHELEVIGRDLLPDLAQLEPQPPALVAVIRERAELLRLNAEAIEIRQLLVAQLLREALALLDAALAELQRALHDPAAGLAGLAAFAARADAAAVRYRDLQSGSRR